ncbi:deoxyribonuclease V [Bythopirellula polymerisocia]|uniref:Endonuclease V n=1 Tax=Bythopirellula polymerisocia TaxID=2528003 RepID=A0A5C6C4U4_9BACT|nr:deoxyribonuclease V [Bythopirellula polymerisocia]TWU17829.1 Endonuclease V [Bythopirellula polymerisocia]
MSLRSLHSWNVTPTEAREIQERFRNRVRQKNAASLRRIRHVAGVDVSLKAAQVTAAIVVLDYPTLELVDVATQRQKVSFPYVPGLLTFRECPAILAAYEKLQIEPDLMLVDGQGIAHPRRFGLAAHLGVLLGKPTIGCAKSRLIGTHDEPHEQAGCYTDLFDGNELIGAVLRTRANVKPLYISVGHNIELPTALDFVLDCCQGYRLPEPTRLAHQSAGGLLRSSRARY